VDGQYAARAMEMVSAAVGTVAPKIKFVNELTKPDLVAAAAQLDKGISKLQSDDLGETATAQFNLSTWMLTSHANGEFRVPWDVSVGGNTVLDDMVRVGSWRIYVKCPRVSLFSERNICVEAAPSTAYAAPNGSPIPKEEFAPDKVWAQKRKVAVELSNREILNFKIASDKSIGEFAKSQTWYQDWLSERKPKKEGDAVDDTSKAAELRDQRFCDNAAQALGASGQGNLSSFDTGLAVRALINDMPDFVEYQGQMTNRCRALVRFKVPAGLENWESLLEKPK
jgi:hypothetical protein